MWEEHGRGRIGLEAYYTGRQELDDNPYRTVRKPYFEIGALAEIVLGEVRLFLNAESMLNIRQTKMTRCCAQQGLPTGAGRSTSGHPPTASC